MVETYLFYTNVLICSPDRWDNLPEAVSSQPGLYSNLLTFSAGPRVRHLFYIAISGLN